MPIRPKRKNRWLDESCFEVKDSRIAGAGKGLYTRCTIYRGDTIGPYTGVLVSDDEVNNGPYLDSHYILWLCDDYQIVAEGETANYTRYINHSDRPNVRFVVSTRWKKARVEALRRILPGEELFLDYGPDFWAATDIGKARPA
jgi:SET domain-containing protein